MTDNDPAGSTPPKVQPAPSRPQEPEPEPEPELEPELELEPEPELELEPEPELEPAASEPAEDPGYLTVTGEAAGEDGSVAMIIGGLPAVEGSAWDIGAPLDDRGGALVDEPGPPPDQASDEGVGRS